jgi:DinB superfamily
MSSEPPGINDFLLEYRKIVENSAARLLEMSEEQSKVAKYPGKWSAKEIIGHLIDSAANNHQRFVRAQFSDELIFQGYDQAEWVKVQHYIDESWHQLIQLWKHYNLHLTHLISAIPEQKLTQSRSLHNLDRIAWETVDKKQQATLEYFVRDYVGHLRHHLAQILGKDNDTQ